MQDQTNFGPYLKYEQTYRDCQKLVVSPQNSIESKSEAEPQLNNLQSKYNWSLSPRQLQPSTHLREQVLLPFDQKESNTKTRPKNSLFKAMHNGALLHKLRIKTIVQRFANLLLKRAYILPSQKKSISNIERYELKSQYGMSEFDNQKKSASSRFPTFTPGAKLLIIWDLIGLLINLLSFWLCPFIASFPQSRNNMVTYPIVVYLFLDLISTLNRAIIIQGEVISNRAIIIKEFFKGQGTEDIISCIIWIMVSQEGFSPDAFQEILAIVQLLITGRKLNSNFEKYIEQLYIKGAVNNLIDLISIIVAVYYFAHIMACGMHFLGFVYEKEGSWLDKYELRDCDTLVRYNYSFYWATMTMVTVGYGDITPTTQLELVYVNISMLLSSCMFAYSMSSIGMILKTIYDQKQKLKRTLISINNFMKKNLVNLEIQGRVRNYLKYRNQLVESNESTEELEQILTELPTGLQSQLKQDIQMRIVNSIQVLKQNFTEDNLRKVAHIMRMKKIMPGDIIFKQNEPDENLYFIQDGFVLIQEAGSGQILEELGANKSFGQYQFFTSNLPRCSAISQQFTTLFVVPRQEFLSIISATQKDFEKFHNLQYNVLFQNNFSQLAQLCSFCGNPDHQSVDCPSVHFYADLEKLVKQIHFRTEPQSERVRIEKRCLVKANSRALRDQIQMSLDHFQQDMNSLSQLDEKNQSKMYEGVSRNQIGEPKSIKSYTEQESPNSVIPTPTSGVPQQNNVATPIRRANQNLRPSVIMQNQRGRPSIAPKATNKKITLIRKDEFSLNFQQSQREISMLDEFVNHLQFHLANIDKQRNYTFFLPHNNLRHSISSAERGRKNRQNHALIQSLHRTSKYTFSIKTQNMIQNIYKMLQNQNRSDK